MRDDFDAMKADRKARKDERRKANERLLERTGLPWVKKNNGAHWTLRRGAGLGVDVFPGTGCWLIRLSPSSRRRGRGVSQLLKLMGVSDG